MPAKFTSDVKGRIVNSMEVSFDEAERLMADDTKTFFAAPSIAPEGFMDSSAGMSIFPIIGTDGGIVLDKFIVYEVVDEGDPRAIEFRKQPEATA